MAQKVQKWHLKKGVKMDLQALIQHPVATGRRLYQEAQSRKQLNDHHITLDRAIRDVITYGTGPSDTEYEDERILLCWYKDIIDYVAVYWRRWPGDARQRVFYYRISTTGQFGEAEAYEPGEWEDYILELQRELVPQAGAERRLMTYYPPGEQDIIAQALYIIKCFADDNPEAYQFSRVKGGTVKNYHYSEQYFELKYSEVELKRRPAGYYLEIIARGEGYDSERVLQALKEADRWVIRGTCQLGEWCERLAESYEFYRRMYPDKE